MKKILFFITLASIVLAFFAIGGYRVVGSGIAKLTTDFKVLDSDDRILYEIGAKTLAEEAAQHLPQAIKDVEAKQYGSFKDPIKIYAFATAKSFSKFSGISEAAKGGGLKNEVYLSGKLLNIMGEVQGIVTHELSHIQLSQTLGVIKFNRTLPRWFREGLAIYVANGGGATNATEAETIDNFLQGKHFIPKTKGTLFNQKLPSTGNLEPKIFYRQSGMFVQYVAHNYSIQFEAFLRGLQKGNSFEPHFRESFGINTDEMLKIFILQLHDKTT